MLAGDVCARQKHGPRAHAEGHDGRPLVRWHEPHQTRPDKAGAALSPMKGGSILYQGLTASCRRIGHRRFGRPDRLLARRDTGSILRRCADDGYRRILKNACSFPDVALPACHSGAGVALRARPHAVLARIAHLRRCRCRCGRFWRGLVHGDATAREAAQPRTIGGPVVSFSRFSLHRSSPAFVPPERAA
jgi:hypothetical protein